MQGSETIQNRQIVTGWGLNRGMTHSNTIVKGTSIFKFLRSSNGPPPLKIQKYFYYYHLSSLSLVSPSIFSPSKQYPYGEFLILYFRLFFSIHNHQRTTVCMFTYMPSPHSLFLLPSPSINPLIHPHIHPTSSPTQMQNSINPY